MKLFKNSIDFILVYIFIFVKNLFNVIIIKNRLAWVVKIFFFGYYYLNLALVV